MSLSDRIKGIVFLLIFIGIGVAMIVVPEAVDGLTDDGRRSLVKSVLVWIWGLPGGITLVVLSLILIAGLIFGDHESEETDEAVAAKG